MTSLNGFETTLKWRGIAEIKYDFILVIILFKKINRNFS